MPIPIRLEQDHGIDSVLGEWAQHLERALRAHFPGAGRVTQRARARSRAVQRALNELQQRARDDEALARRRAL